MNQLTNVTIQITAGPGKNKVRIITGGTANLDGTWTLTLSHTWLSPFPAPGNPDVPDATSKYVLMQTNPNLLVNEADQTDILQVHDTDNVNNYDDPAAPAPAPGSVDRNPFASGQLFFDSTNLFGAKATVSTEVNGGPKVDGPTVSEVQQLVLTATAGTFTLIFDGSAVSRTTAALPFNPTAAQVQSALEALSNIGAGNVAVAKDPIDPKYTITFQGALTNIDVPRIHADATNLTGGLPLDQFRITGLGMGGDGPSFQRTVGTGTDGRSEPGGIAFQQFEDLEIDLGRGTGALIHAVAVLHPGREIEHGAPLVFRDTVYSEHSARGRSVVSDARFRANGTIAHGAGREELAPRHHHEPGRRPRRREVDPRRGSPGTRPATLAGGDFFSPEMDFGRIPFPA